MAWENSGWGCDGGALANLGHYVPDQTIGNVLRRHSPGGGVQAQPKHRVKGLLSPTWQFWLAIDFFTVAACLAPISGAIAN
jgi:hypothetical protein